MDAGDEQLVCYGWMLSQAFAKPGHVGTSVASPMLSASSCLRPPLPGPPGWQGDCFTRRTDAEAAAAGHDPATTFVLTVAMQAAEAAIVLAEADEPRDPALMLLARSEPFSDAAVVLGWEVVGGTGTFHSWHCYGLADLARHRIGVSTGRFGLLTDSSAAYRVLDWLLALDPSEAPAPVGWSVIALAVDREAAVPATTE